MKKRRIGCLAMLGVVLFMAGCSSAVIDTWADRGLAGVENARQTLLLLQAARLAAISDSQADDIAAVFGDLRTLAENAQDPNSTRPKLTPADLENQHGALLVLLAAGRREEADARAAFVKALGNLDQTAECFERIKQLRQSWGSSADIDARLAHLTTLVNALLQERRAAP